MALLAFQPQGDTKLITASTAPSAAVQPSAGSIQGLRIANLSTADAWVAIGMSSTLAAVAPSTSASGDGFPILQRSRETFTVPPNCYVSAVTTGAGMTALLALTPGFGLD